MGSGGKWGHVVMFIIGRVRDVFACYQGRSVPNVLFEIHRLDSCFRLKASRSQRVHL